MRRLISFLAIIIVLTACSPSTERKPATSTNTPTATVEVPPSATLTSIPVPTATATEAATATPEIQIAPSNAEFINYSISTDTIVNHTDDLVAKARQLDWDPDSTNPKYVNMGWIGSELLFDIKTAPNYKDPSARFFQRRVIGINTDKDGTVSIVGATRFQLPEFDPKDYPIVVGVADEYDGSPITEDNINDAVNTYLNDMDYTVYYIPENGPIQSGLAAEYFQAHPEKLAVVRNVFSQLRTYTNAPGKSNFSAIKDLDGMVLPFEIEVYYGGAQVYR